MIDNPIHQFFLANITKIEIQLPIMINNRIQSLILIH